MRCMRVQAEHDGVAAGTRNVLIMGQALIDGFEPGSLGEPPEVPGRGRPALTPD